MLVANTGYVPPGAVDEKAAVDNDTTGSAELVVMFIVYKGAVGDGDASGVVPHVYGVRVAGVADGAVGDGDASV